MPIRKTRIACQGDTNQSQMSLMETVKSMDKTKIKQRSLLKQGSKLTKFTDLDNDTGSKYLQPNATLTQQNHFTEKQSKLSHNKSAGDFTQLCGNEQEISKYKQLLRQKRRHPKKNATFEQQKAKMPTARLEGILQKIRTTYKNSGNVRKIMKAWGFENKGCISDDQFQEIVNKHFDPTVSKEDCQEIFRNLSPKGHQQNIELLSFIQLVFEQQPFTRPQIHVLDHVIENGVKGGQMGPTKTLINKIHDLNEGSLYNKIQQNNKKKSILPHLRNKSRVQDSNTNKVITSSFINTGKNSQLQKTQPSLYQTMHMKSSPKFTFSTKESHTLQFTPTSLYGINQQKTRHNATPFIALNDQSSVQNKREKICDQKIKVVAQLSQQRQKQKVTYEAKLQRIRHHQQQEKENVLQIDTNLQQRDKANMMKLREENLAYNYVNFIHNDWK